MGWVLGVGRWSVQCSKSLISWTSLCFLFMTANKVSLYSISEISPPSARAMLMSGYQTILQISALAGFWGAYFSHSYFPLSSALQYSFPIAIQLVPSCLLLLGTIFVIPETPRFLAEKGRIEDAEKSLAWLRGAEQGEEWMVSGEMEEIRDAVDIGRRLKEKSGSFAKEVLKNGVRRRLVVGVGLMIAQNMVGLNALNYCEPLSPLLSSLPLPISASHPTYHEPA